ncbi:hypothetical protein KCU93_g9030, partial [Aureobasidium melanogenum]
MTMTLSEKNAETGQTAPLQNYVIEMDYYVEAPLPAVVQYSGFIADALGWHNDGTSTKETFEHARHYLVKALSVKQKASSKVDTVSTLLAQASRRPIF